jgi:hypothetical protein
MGGSGNFQAILVNLACKSQCKLPSPLFSTNTFGMIFLFKLFNSEFIVMNNIHLGELK